MAFDVADRRVSDLSGNAKDAKKIGLGFLQHLGFKTFAVILLIFSFSHCHKLLHLL